MSLPRERIAPVLLALCAAIVGLPAIAQTGYPVKPIRWIVPWPPGGGADVLSRMLSPKLSEALRQQIVIDNRGGAAGNIGAEMAAKAPPDGYTIVFAYSGTHASIPASIRSCRSRRAISRPSSGSRRCRRCWWCIRRCR